MEWSIQELARAAGVSSRTLRHYGERGLLEPSRLGANGMRYYGEDALPTLLRILLLRSHGVGLDAVGRALAAETDPVLALREHVTQLRRERRDLSRRITSVERTITAMEGGEPLMAEQVFEEFDHTKYQEEVEARWGADAYRRGDRWWRSMSDEDKNAFGQEHVAISAAYQELAESGAPLDSPETEAVVARHVAWLEQPMGRVSREYVVGLGEGYVADPRFAANYPGYVEYVRDAMRSYAEKHLA